MFAFQDKRGSVEVAFTDRFGGMSPGPFASLDLAVPTAAAADARGCDELSLEEELAENWDIAMYAMLRGGPAAGDDLFDLPPGTLPGLATATGMRQVHGSHVEVVEPGEDGFGPREEPEADALVTATAGVLLAARAADCVPVLLADPERGLVSAAHCGRKGLVAGIVPAALDALRDLGAERVVAWVGPHACGRCYEVPSQMRDEVSELVPQARSATSWGTPALDLGAGVLSQLETGVHGLVVDDLVTVDRCTIEDSALYSYRRDGVLAGRHAGLIWVRP